MQVVLKKRVPKLGNEHDVVNVKAGYAHNFLFRQNLAVPASKHELQKAEGMKAKMTAKVEAVIENAKEVAGKLKDITLTFKQKAKEDKLYGSIAEKDIITALKEQVKMEVNKDMVKMAEHIKTVGEHKVKVQLTEDITVSIKVLVEAEG